MKTLLTLTAALGATTALSLPAMAQQKQQMPSTLTEGNWVSLTGQITSIDEDSLHLEYGGGEIEVEFEGMFGDPNEDQLYQGQQITAYGYVDDDFFEGNVLDAEGIYASERYTYYGSMDDSWGTSTLNTSDWNAEDGTQVAFEGEVVSTDGREFVLDVAGTRVEVDTADLGYNPVDDTGYPQIDMGDRVSVSGTLEDTLFDNTELSAESVLIVNRI